MKVTPYDYGTFWVSNPSGRGRWCTLGADGVVRDKATTMFLESSPACYQKAIDKYLRENPVTKPAS